MKAYTATRSKDGWNLVHRDYPMLNEKDARVCDGGFISEGRFIDESLVYFSDGSKIENLLIDRECDNNYAKWAIEENGTDYAVTCLRSASNFVDPKTRKLWKEAKDAIEALENYLEPYNAWGEDDDFDD